jgi:hypothetical protein
MDGTWLCLRVGYSMLQSGLTVAGLMLDSAGFALLLREWWLAFFNEGRQIEAEEQLEHMRHLRSLRPPSSGTDSFAALHKIQDDQAMRSARVAHKSAMAARRAVFLTAAVLIAAGFVLQLAGAWPI